MGVRITELIALVHREVDRLFVFIFQSMHMGTPPPPACLLRLLLTTASYVLAVKASQTDVAMARLVALRSTLRQRVGVSPRLLV